MLLLVFAVVVAGVEGVVPGADEAFCTDFGAMGGRGRPADSGIRSTHESANSVEWRIGA